MKKYSRLLISALAVSAAVSADAQIDLNYYVSLQGLSGADLKTAVHHVCRDNFEIQGNVVSVYSGLNQAFRITDSRAIDGVEYWWDMYSADLNPLTMTFSECGYEREHAFPKSWWKDTDTYGTSTTNVTYTTAYCDMHHLFPSNGSANGSKSNWPLGEVAKAGFDNGVVKTGTPRAGMIYGISGIVSKVFEPADEYKGDFARAYMYVVTAYQDLKWNEENLWMVQRNTYPTLTDWARDLLQKWHRADAVSDKEVTRNIAVESLQHNRNPFIDFPNLYEYIWGDSIGRPFDIYTTVKSSRVVGGMPETVEDTFYTCTFTGGDDGGCTTTDDVAVSFKVWQNTTTYGWKASGYYRGAPVVTDSRLETPEIDLSMAVSATVNFDHAVNYSDCSYMSVGVLTVDDGVVHDITSQIDWPKTQSWTFISSGTVDISAYTGHRVKLVFRYTSDAAAAGTWEVKNLVVDGLRKVSSITSVEVDAEDATAEYYSIDGRRVDPAVYRGPAIRRTGSKVTKTIIR